MTAFCGFGDSHPTGMKSEAAEQVAAPAETSNTQLAPGTQLALTECGWKGGDSWLGQDTMAFEVIHSQGCLLSNRHVVSHYCAELAILWRDHIPLDESGLENRRSEDS